MFRFEPGRKMPQKSEVVYELSRPSRCFNCDRKLPRNEMIKLVRSEAVQSGDETEREVHCLKCAGLESMVVVQSGNAKLTRLAKKYSNEVFVILQWSELWKTYERKGLLVEQEAFTKAQSEL